MASRAVVSAAYTADRAAALAGVPKSTLYYWARTGVVAPSVSRERVKRWSYADLLVLRLVDWLRREKTDDVDVARVSVQQLRRVLDRIDLGEHLMERGFDVWVDRRGRLAFEGASGMFAPLGRGFAQHLVDTKVNLIRPFQDGALRGPDLVRPRPSLRIVPGKLSGEPHVAATRIPTKMIAVLADRGFNDAAILEMYSSLNEANVHEAVELEKQLEENLHVRAA